jgi:hypothetical protein
MSAPGGPRRVRKILPATDFSATAEGGAPAGPQMLWGNWVTPRAAR